MADCTTQKLVIDKSFLDGASTTQVRDVVARYHALVIEPLFYELMTTEKPDMQRKAFAKFPPEPGSFSLIPNIGTLLRNELERREPLRRLEGCAIEGVHKFNDGLRDGNYVPNGQVLEDLQAWEAEVVGSTQTFLEMSQSVHQFFPELSGIEFRDFPAAIATARQTVATSQDRVMQIFAQLRTQDETSMLPPEIVGPDWISYRFLQCHLLAALRLFGKHQGNINVTPGVRLRAEHAMHDLEYVLAGSMVGGIATNDREVEEDFRLLCPGGLVIKPMRGETDSSEICQP